MGDTISTTKEGSVQLAINGYSTLDISPLASVSISDAGKDFLTYENLSGQVKYAFSKREEGNFTYKIKGKTGYATIRGTTLEVNSTDSGNTYALIEGKIDVYNSVLKKTVSMVS